MKNFSPFSISVKYLDILFCLSYFAIIIWLVYNQNESVPIGSHLYTDKNKECSKLCGILKINHKSLVDMNHIFRLYSITNIKL